MWERLGSYRKRPAPIAAAITHRHAKAGYELCKYVTRCAAQFLKLGHHSRVPESRVPSIANQLLNPEERTIVRGARPVMGSLTPLSLYGTHCLRSDEKLLECPLSRCFRMLWVERRVTSCTAICLHATLTLAASHTPAKTPKSLASLSPLPPFVNPDILSIGTPSTCFHLTFSPPSPSSFVSSTPDDSNRMVWQL